MAATTGTQISKSYVSALDPLLDTREINKKVTDIYNEDELSDILGYGDKKMPTKQPVYYTFYDDPLVKYIDTAGIGSVGGSGTAQITLTTVVAAFSGFTRVNDLVMFTNNNVGIVYSVTSSSGTDTIVIKSVSGANLTCTEGDKLSLFSRAVGENASTGTNIRYGVSKTSNKYQIFDTTCRITDVQNASTVEVDFQGQNKWFFKDQWEKRVKGKSDINAAFFGGQMSNTTFSDTNPALTDPITSADGLSGGGAQQTTRGINQYIYLYGTSLVNGTLDLYQKANLDDAVANLIAIRAPREYLVVGSTRAITTVSDYFKNLGSSGVTSVRMVVNGKELDMNIDKVQRGKFTLNYAVMPILDHPVTFGFSKIPKSLFYIPYNNKVKVEGGGSDDQVRVRYVPRQAMYGDDMTNEIHYGAYSPINPNGTGAFIGIDTRTAQGLEVLAPQHLMSQQVLS